MFRKKHLLLYLFIALTIVLMACSNDTASEESEGNIEEGEAVEETKPANVEESVDAKRAENKDTVPDGFRVTTVGTGSPPIEGEKTWPSTLVQFQDKYFLVDCGGGCTHGLTKAGIHPREITNILFTHHHVDHNSDFITVLMAGWATNDPRTELNLLGTEGTKEFYNFVIDFYEQDIQYRIDTGYTTGDGMIENVNIQELHGEEELELDGVKISTLDVPHSIKTIAYKFEAGGQTVVLSADTTFNEELIEFSEGADLMVLDGMLAEVKKGDPFYEEFQHIKPQLASAHLTLEEAGQTAAEANVKKVVFHHLMNGEIDEEKTTEVMREAGYTGEVMIGETLKQYDVEE
ncbi:ribonuclease Z [Alteribacillus persepolensis]|uniref:Ribonuclease Z n=1 Tax=Alteribacillus persepolensis TaxID=568899 RepID=A0A1G8DSG9_9BACI|nr:MBL fold metallo-hydrolase [Alteribacillus persepolensis]SDH60637.1 ribonuclease Z [Alteribacillus persepolensis]